MILCSGGGPTLPKRQKCSVTNIVKKIEPRGKKRVTLVGRMQTSALEFLKEICVCCFVMLSVATVYNVEYWSGKDLEGSVRNLVDVLEKLRKTTKNFRSQ
jgi:hypothetical protein